MAKAKAYRLTPRALEDLKDIGRYTQQNFGIAQRNKYLLELDACFVRLANQPRLGKHRTDIAPDYYSFTQGKHIVFYQISAHGIDVIGIVHQRMDILVYFDGV